MKWTVHPLFNHQRQLFLPGNARPPAPHPGLPGRAWQSLRETPCHGATGRQLSEVFVFDKDRFFYCFFCSGTSWSTQATSWLSCIAAVKRQQGSIIQRSKVWHQFIFTLHAEWGMKNPLIHKMSSPKESLVQSNLPAWWISTYGGTSNTLMTSPSW